MAGDPADETGAAKSPAAGQKIAPPGHQPYLDEPAYLGREFTTGPPRAYERGVKLYWVAPLLFFSGAAAVATFVNGNYPAFVGATAVFVGLLVLAFFVVRRQVRRDVTRGAPRRYP